MKHQWTKPGYVALYVAIASVLGFSVYRFYQRSVIEFPPDPPASELNGQIASRTQELFHTNATPGITLIAGGDVTLGYSYQGFFDEQLSQGRTKKELFDYPFANVANKLTNADLAVFNLECPFTARGERLPKTFNFRARPELAESLIGSGVDVVSLANNHMMDYGPAGIIDTFTALNQLHIAHFGAGANMAGARKPAVLTRNGTKVAFLGYLYGAGPRKMWASETTPGVAGVESDVSQLLRMLREDVPAARKLADIVVVFFHFGVENSHGIEDYQAVFAHGAVDAGADLILGAHPHVVQGAEWYNGVPVVYSLGNFVFGGSKRARESALFDARFEDRKVVETEFLPIMTARLPEAQFQPYFLEGEARENVLQGIIRDSAGFPKPLLQAPGSQKVVQSARTAQ